MRDYATVTWLIWPYVISFIFIVTYVLLNLFIAVLLGNFTNVLTKGSAETVSQASLYEYRRVWADLAQDYAEEYRELLGKYEKNSDQVGEFDTSFCFFIACAVWLMLRRFICGCRLLFFPKQFLLPQCFRVPIFCASLRV